MNEEIEVGLWSPFILDLECKLRGKMFILSRDAMQAMTFDNVKTSKILPKNADTSSYKEEIR